MCNGNVFLARKIAETHFDCSCAVEIAFFLRGEKSRETCGLIMCSGHLFFCGKKAKKHKYINHVQWNLFKRKRVV